MMCHLNRKQEEWKAVLLVFGLLLAIFNGIYGRYLPTAQGTLGHDMGLAFTSMLDGFFWFTKNGPWEVPWFTPSFCGGQPFFADPQSGYYSLLQWLTFITDPLTATHWTLLWFASAGFFGIYLLARAYFGLALPWAILAATLYFFNGFLPHRMIIGHLGYSALTLACQGKEGQAPKVVFGFILMIIIINVAEPRGFYAYQAFSLAALLSGYDRLAASGANRHRIMAIGLTTPVDTDEGLAGLSGYNVILAGVSQAQYYNPTFGYRLENLPPAQLRMADVLS